MNKIDAIFIDLDGTLLTSKKEVSDENKKILIRCLNQSIDVYLISGRPIFFVDAIADSIDSRCNRIGFNGAVLKIGKNIYEKSIDKDNLKKIWNIIQKNSISKFYFKGINSVYCSDEDSRFTYSNLENEGKIHVYKNVKSLDSINNSIYKVLLIDENDNKLESITEECHDFLSITSSHIHSLDIMEKNIQKGEIVKKICVQNKYEKTISFGDGNNDISMLQVTTFSFAMKNSTNYIKNQVKYVTEYTNDEDGVAKEIYKFVN